jgi:hypothetical protein
MLNLLTSWAACSQITIHLVLNNLVVDWMAKCVNT